MAIYSEVSPIVFNRAHSQESVHWIADQWWSWEVGCPGANPQSADPCPGSNCGDVIIMSPQLLPALF